MLSVLLQTLALASAGLLAPGSMTIVILLLLSERGRRNGWGYVLGYLSGYTILGLATVVLSANMLQPSQGRSPLGLSVFLIFLGFLLLGLTAWNALRPAVSNPAPPRLFTLLDRVTPPRAAALGALVTVMNFKNLGLFFSSLSVVVLSFLPLLQKVLITLPAVFVFCSAVLLPLLGTLFFPRRSHQLLLQLKQLLTRHSRALSIWATLIFGLLILTKGVFSLP